jgi:hypothetical protein
LTDDVGRFDPRVLPLLLPWPVLVVVAARARMIVADGALWRRASFVNQVVSLDALVSVKVRRANHFEREGLPTRIVEIRDRYGRFTSWKPLYWSRSNELNAFLASYVNAQRLWLDDATRTFFDGAAMFGTPPVLIASPPGPTASLPPPPPPAPPKPSWSTKRVIAGLTIFLLFTCLVVVSAIAAPAILQTMRCSTERDRWTAAADVGGASLDPVSVTEGLAEPLRSTFGPPSLLYGAPILPAGSPASLQETSSSFAFGQAVVWGGRGDDLRALVEVDRYSSHEAALAYVSEWGDWRCADDQIFSVDEVPGAVGFRVCDSAVNRDHVLFVRGDTVVRVMAVVPRDEGTGVARRLAERTSRAL